MKLSKILTNEADEIILRLRSRPSHEALNRALRFTQSLESDAYYHYLDGKVVRCRALRRLASKVRAVALKVKVTA